MQDNKQRLPIINEKRAWFLTAFFAVEFLLWQCVIHAFGGWGKYVSYTAVALSFVFALFLSGRDTLCVIGGLACTCVADVFLVLLGREGDTFAMCVFLCAQSFYAAQTYAFAKGKGERRAQLLVRGIASVLGNRIFKLCPLRFVYRV